MNHSAIALGAAAVGCGLSAILWFLILWSENKDEWTLEWEWTMVRFVLSVVGLLVFSALAITYAVA